jgi:hypothetical protein
VWGLRDGSPEPMGHEGHDLAEPDGDHIIGGDGMTSLEVTGGPCGTGATDSASNAVRVESVGTSGSIISNGGSSGEPAEKDGVAADGLGCSRSDPVAQPQVQSSGVISAVAGSGFEPTAPAELFGGTAACAVVPAPDTNGGAELGVATSSTPDGISTVVSHSFAIMPSSYCSDDWRVSRRRSRRCRDAGLGAPEGLGSPLRRFCWVARTQAATRLAA